MADIRSLISSKIRIELLKILTLNPECSFNINEIGRSINISQFRSDEFNQRIEQKDHFLTRVLESPKVNIFGQEDES